MTGSRTVCAQLYLRVLHVETVSEILTDVALDAGHVSTPGQPGEIGPEGLTSNIESNPPVDTISEAVVLRHLTRTLCSVQLHVLDHLGNQGNLMSVRLYLYGIKELTSN